MKHRALSMLLALVMVVSLLPAAVTANGAEENTGAEEQKETVEMGENDSQQGGDGEESQLPTEENEIVKKGTAKMPMLEALGLENIQIRLIPAKMLYECYLTQRKININLFEL